MIRLGTKAETLEKLKNKLINAKFFRSHLLISE